MKFYRDTEANALVLRDGDIGAQFTYSYVSSVSGDGTEEAIKDKFEDRKIGEFACQTFDFLNKLFNLVEF